MTYLLKKSCVSVCVSVTPHAGRLLNFGFVVSFVILKISLFLCVVELKKFYSYNISCSINITLTI